MCKQDGSCGCGCPARRVSAKRTGERRASLRDVREDQVSYRFATAAALVRQERMTGPQARQAVQEAGAIVDSRMRQGDSPASAARYVASLPTTRSSYPPPARGDYRYARDPQRSKKAKTSASKEDSRLALRSASRTRSLGGARWNGRKRPEAGVMKVSKKGNPYRVCPRGTRIQTLIFPLTQFTQKKASKWARDHGFRIQKIDVTSQSIRIRQQPVELFTKGSFRTITLPSRTGTIRAVIGCPRFAIIAGGRARQERQEMPARRRLTRRQAARRLRRAA